MANPVTEALEERLKSEVLGTFSLSMILCSWKIWIYVFSSLPAIDKIKQIDGFLYSWQIIQVIAEALFASGIILFALPYFKVWYAKWNGDRQASIPIHEARRAAAQAAEINGMRSILSSAASAESRIMSGIDDVSISVNQMTLFFKQIQMGIREDDRRTGLNQIIVIESKLKSLSDASDRLIGVKGAVEKILETFPSK